MGYRRCKKRGQGPQRKNTEFRTRVQKFERRSPSSGPSFDSVPNWEKSFCSQIKWSDFCNNKRIIHIFPNVLDWDDSAGKEAFDDAKARYWAKINNLPSEIPLPDPNMCIQEVDYDAYVDPSLLEDLYQPPPPPPPPPASPDLSSIKITPTGWDVVAPSPTANIPKFIFARPSTADDNKNSKFGINDESIRIIPTGWGEEDDTMLYTVASSSWGRHENGSCSSNHANRRCHEQGGYHKDRWTKYIKEQYFWRQKTPLVRGFSCAHR